MSVLEMESKIKSYTVYIQIRKYSNIVEYLDLLQPFRDGSVRRFITTISR